MDSKGKKFVPVMITPFNLKAKVDLDAVSVLVDFYLAAGVLFMFIGTGLFVYYKVHPAPVSLRSDAVFPYFIMTKLPSGLVGFIISAMASAAICSMGADLNSLGAVGVEDYYKKLRPGRSDQEYLRTGRWIVFGSGILSILIAMLYVHAGSDVIAIGYLASLFFPRPKLDENLLYSGWLAARRREKSGLKVVALVAAFVSFGTEGVLHAQTAVAKEAEPWRRSFKEGVAALDRLAALYHNKEEWEKRAADLRPCLYEAMKLSPLPEQPAITPIITPWRKMDGYEVENVAIPLLPGLYVNGSLYRPLNIRGKIPVILNPDGHFERHRYRAECQIRCAAEARMGAMAFSYDLFAWGESLLQFRKEDHKTPLAMTLQLLAGIRVLDYLLSLKEADKERVGITGASGGGTQTVLLTAMDPRIKVSVPVVMVSAYFDGGCPCEHGRPIHACAGGTDNVELAAMAAPRPQLLVSDGKDWTAHMPEHDFPYLQQVYGYYGAAAAVENVHLPAEGHDYGLPKRKAMYPFMAKHLGLDMNAILDKNGNIDESKCTVEPDTALYVFGAHGEKLPADAIKGFENLERVFAEARVRVQMPGPGADVRQGSRYKVAVVDLMLLKRQKLGAFSLAKTVGADGLEVDMGGLGDRETFENQLVVDSIRQQFLDKAKELHLEISSLAMTGFYAQSFATRPTWQRMIGDCIKTMREMHVGMAFLPLGVNADLAKHPELRPAVVERLKAVGRMAEEAGVVIGIETSLDAAGDLQLLKEIGSPAIKIYFNFANALDAKRDLYEELRILGKENICQIHCSNSDGYWLQNDPAIDLKKIKALLDKMGWSGWLVIERSRDAKDVHNVKGNFGANTSYVKSIFQ